MNKACRHEFGYKVGRANETVKNFHLFINRELKHKEI